MKNVAKLEKEEFEKNFICPAERIWLEQGIEKGIKQVVHKMLSKKGITIAEVSKFTGISVAELKKLKDKKH